MLKQRIITAVLLAPLVLLIIIYGDALFFSLFTAALVMLIGFEWYQLARNNNINSGIVALLVAAIVFMINFSHQIAVDVQRITLAAAVLWSMALIWMTRPEQGKSKTMIKYAFGVGVLLLFGTSLIHLHETKAQGAILTLFLFLLVWVADIGAYVAGKNFGRHKLAPRVSPGKTIEGLAGGLVLSAIYGFIVGKSLNQDVLYFILAFPIIAAISVIGDLFASLLKRHANIKDSGFLLPGHGGFLDRFDSLVAATPFYCAFIHYFYQA